MLTEVLYGSPRVAEHRGADDDAGARRRLPALLLRRRWWTDDYRTFVQYCTSPTGDCNRIYSTPVSQNRGSMVGPGAPTVFQDPSGNWMMGFHAWTAPYIEYKVVGDIR